MAGSKMAMYVGGKKVLDTFKPTSKDAKQIAKTELKVNEEKKKLKAKKQLKMSPFPSLAFYGPKYVKDGELLSNTSVGTWGNATYWAPNRFSFPEGTVKSSGQTQPIGHNIFYAGYQNAKVYGVYVDLEVMNGSGKDQTLLIQFNPSGQTFTGTGSNLAHQASKRNTWTYQIEAEQGKPFKFERYFDVRKIDSLSKAQFNADITNYSSALATSAAAYTEPARVPFLVLANMNNVDANQVGLVYKIKFSYVVQFFNRVKQAITTTTA